MSVLNGRAPDVTINDDLKIPGDSPLELCPGDHAADLIVQLAEKDKGVQGVSGSKGPRDDKGSGDRDGDEGGEGEEDAVLRDLRLNLLALAKRAPLDKIARLPADLVPEPIRHIVPTIEHTPVST